MLSRERELRHLHAAQVRTYEPILANDNSTEAEVNTAAAAVAKANLYKAEARALGITLPSTVAELNAPVDEPAVRPGTESAEAPREGAALRSNQRVQDLPDIPKTGLRLGKFLRGIAVDNWKDAAEEKRAIQNEGTGSAGSYLTNPELSAQVVDLIRANQVMQAAGAATIRMQDSTTPQLFMAKLLTDPTSQWLSEAAAATPSTATFGRITFTPKVLTTMVEASVELLQDSPTAEDELTTSITRSLAVELDRVGLSGSGSGAQPQGIKGTANVGANTPGANGDTIVAASAYSAILAGMNAIRQTNVEPDFIVRNPRTHTTYDGLVDTLYQPLRKPDAVDALKDLQTTAISAAQTRGTGTTCTDIFLGRGSDVAYALWLDLQFDVSRVAATSTTNSMLNRTVLIRAMLRADVQVLRPGSFYVVSGILN
jgi:HK97 family phage major capsid protein